MVDHRWLTYPNMLLGPSNINSHGLGFTMCTRVPYRGDGTRGSPWIQRASVEVVLKFTLFARSFAFKRSFQFWQLLLPF